MSQKNVLVTGANGYIGNAVAKAFARAGWRTFGLIRRANDGGDLARHEIRPIIGTPDELSFLAQVDGVSFDVVVSNTEDRRNPSAHFEAVGRMFDAAASSGTAGNRPLMLLRAAARITA